MNCLTHFILLKPFLGAREIVQGSKPHILHAHCHFFNTYHKDPKELSSMSTAGYGNGLEQNQAWELRNLRLVPWSLITTLVDTLSPNTTVFFYFSRQSWTCPVHHFWDTDHITIDESTKLYSALAIACRSCRGYTSAVSFENRKPHIRREIVSIICYLKSWSFKYSQVSPYPFECCTETNSLKDPFKKSRLFSMETL